MLRRQRFAFVAGRDHRLAVDQVFDRNIGAVVAIAVDHGEGRRRLGQARGLEQGVDADALPMRVELRPSGDAMNVDLHAGLRQGSKFGPVPCGNRRVGIAN
jgi:hypothetical protein